MFLRPALLFLLCLAFPFSEAAESLSVPLPGGDEIPVTRHPAPGDTRLLWLPSEFGLSPRQAEVARGLAALGIDTWIADLHSAWFIPPGRYSLNGVDPEAIATLIRRAARDRKQLYLLASGRTAALALRALRRVQLGRPTRGRVRGLISIGPRLFLRTPQGGESAEFLPIAGASNVPVFILQPGNTGGVWYLPRLAEQLRKGGAPVFVQVLKDVRDAFHLRDEYTAREREMSRRLPRILVEAMHLLAAYPGLPAHPAPLAGKDLAPEADRAQALLRPYPGRHPAPGLRLPGLDGRPHRLADLSGRVVLVNFWATWCPPCVEEIPSLQRLYRARHAQGLEILAVDVGQPPAEVRRFLTDKPVDFSVLLDPQAAQLRQWGVHAFPTTFVLDRKHRIRYAGFGAFDWDSPEVLQTLDALLREPH